MDHCEVSVDVWGEFAMFTRPDSKVERVTYDIPTPSACRGILNAIYSKPKEFYYEITGIDVMHPINKISLRKNETQRTAMGKIGEVIDTNESRTQRMNTYLRDVYYRITARIVRQPSADARVTIEGLKKQFEQRVSRGKCFFQPALGTRECLCYFGSPDLSKKSQLTGDVDLGVVLYDVFDITKDNSEKTLDTRRKSLNLCTFVSFFEAKMHDGHIDVPLWNSGKILRKE